jgi:hypothetical protein
MERLLVSEGSFDPRVKQVRLLLPRSHDKCYVLSSSGLRGRGRRSHAQDLVRIIAQYLQDEGWSSLSPARHLLTPFG